MALCPIAPFEACIENVLALWTPKYYKYLLCGVFSTFENHDGGPNLMRTVRQYCIAHATLTIKISHMKVPLGHQLNQYRV